MRKIGIIEVEEHFEFVHTLSRIIYDDCYSVTIFTTREIHDNLKIIMKEKFCNYEFITKDDETWREYFIKIEEICNQRIDLVFFLSMQAYAKRLPTYLKFLPKCKMILGTARYEEWFEDQYSFTISRKSLIHNIQHFYRKKIYPKYAGIFFHSQAETDYIRQTYKPDKYLLTIPFSLYENSIKKIKKIENVIRFSVVGAIEEKRRDYHYLFDSLQLLDRSLYQKFQIKLVGKPVGEYGVSVIERAQDLLKSGINIKWYSEFVPCAIYEKEVMSTDVFLSPTKSEYYTLEGWTAAIVEAVRFNKLIVFPKVYIPMNEVKDISKFYSDRESLSKIISDLIINFSHEENLLNLAKLKEFFSEEKWRKIIHEDIEKILYE